MIIMMSEPDTADTTWTTRLPAVAHMEILNYLRNVKDLINCALTCKVWKDLAYSKSLWENRSIKLNALNSVANVYSLDSFKERGITNITLFLAKDKRNVRTCHHAAEQLIKFTHLLNLEVINVHSLCLHDRHVSAAFDQPMMKLKSVILSRYGSYTHEAILTVLKNCPNLTHLAHKETQSMCNYTGFRRPDEMIIKLTDSLTENISAKLPHIVQLDVSDSTITDAGIHNIAQMRALKCLVAKYCYHLSEECINVLSAAKSSITELDLRWCANVRCSELLTNIGYSCLYLEKLYVHCMMQDEVKNKTLYPLVAHGRAYRLKVFVIEGANCISRNGIEMMVDKCKHLNSFISHGTERILQTGSDRQATLSLLPSYYRDADIQDLQRDVETWFRYLAGPEIPPHLALPLPPDDQIKELLEEYSNSSKLHDAHFVIKTALPGIRKMMARSRNPPIKMVQIFGKCPQENLHQNKL